MRRQLPELLAKARFNHGLLITLMLLRRVKELRSADSMKYEIQYWHFVPNKKKVRDARRETTRMTLDNEMMMPLPMVALEVTVVTVAMRRVHPMAASSCLPVEEVEE